jgi:nucleoside-diphosphate-sugar epimerase
MEKMHRVLITGATGFIGSHLTRRLIQVGFELGIIKRRSSDPWRIIDVPDKIVCFDIDLRNAQEVLNTVLHFKPDAIFHLASYYIGEPSSEEISLIVDTNLLGVINLLDAAKESPLKLFVNTSSCFVYKENMHPMGEEAGLNPVNLYGLTKLQAEEACSFYAKQYGLPIITFRLFSPYGPADHERRLIPYVIMSLLNNQKPKLTTGMQRWDFIYVEDIINAYFKLLSLPLFPKKHEILNVGTGYAVSVKELVTRLAQIMGKDSDLEWGTLPHRKNEVWHLCADINKIQNLLGWKPKVQMMDEGLNRTIAWYKNRGKELMKR